MQTFTYNIVADKYLNNYLSSLTSHISYNFAEFENNLNTSYLQLTLYPNTVNNIEDSISDGSDEYINSILNHVLSSEALISYSEFVAGDKVYTYSVNGKTPDFHKKINQSFIDQFGNTSVSIMSDLLSDGRDYYVVTGRRMFNYYSGNDLGYILFYTNVNQITPMYDSLKTENSNIFVMVDDCIISYSDRSALGKHLWIAAPESDVSNHKLSKSFAKRMSLEGTFGNKINIFVETSYAQTFDIISLLNKINITLLIFAFIVMLICSKIVSRRCLAAVKKLNNDMIAFADHPEGYVPQSRHNEIASLESCFNNMVVRIQELITKNEREQEQKHIAELCMLQAQMKHHFVYNVLDIIFWKAHNIGQKEIENIVLVLSSFLRISLSHGSSFITVREEISHVKNYIALEKLRFDDLFDVEFNISEDILDISILKIILQPLVENCIKHGFKDIDYKGKIQINGYMRDEETLIFEVIDNGRGFSSNPFDSYNQSRSDKISYGLSNIYERLRFEYGSDSKINIIDTYGHGAYIEVVIKYKNKHK